MNWGEFTDWVADNLPVINICVDNLNSRFLSIQFPESENLGGIWVFDMSPRKWEQTREDLKRLGQFVETYGKRLPANFNE